MPILDAGMHLSKNQAGYNSATPTLKGELVTANGATQVLTNWMDQIQARDLGAGEPIYPYFESGANGTAMSGGTSVNAQVVGSDDAAGVVNPVVLSSTGVILLAALTANALFAMPPIQPGIKKRFLTGQIVAVGNFGANAGTVQLGFIGKNARPQLYVQPSGTPQGHNL